MSSSVAWLACSPIKKMVRCEDLRTANGYVYLYETLAGSGIEVYSNNVSGDLMVLCRICTTDFVLILHPSPKCRLAHFPTWISQCWKVPAANVYSNPMLLTMAGSVQVYTLGKRV